RDERGLARRPDSLGAHPTARTRRRRAVATLPPVPADAEVVLTDHGLSADEVVRVARGGARAELGPSAREAMAASAALIEGFLAADEPVYGVTTGFGSLATTSIPVERTAELQLALIRSHAAGMGPEVEREV